MREEKVEMMRILLVVVVVVDFLSIHFSCILDITRVSSECRRNASATSYEETRDSWLHQYVIELERNSSLFSPSPAALCIVLIHTHYPIDYI